MSLLKRMGSEKNNSLPAIPSRPEMAGDIVALVSLDKSGPLLPNA
jgi:hypothetical protein